MLRTLEQLTDMLTHVRTIMVRMGIVLAALAVACVAWGVQSYQPVLGDPLRESWRWRTYLELSGLDAQCVAETADGTMWFGTANGLWSYNGNDWVRHSTNVGRLVMALCPQPDGALYAAGAWGISEYDKGQWTRVFDFSSGRIGYLEEIPIKKMALADDGSLWVATSWGALHRDRSVWTLYTDSITAAAVRKRENLAFLKVELLPESLVGKIGGDSPEHCSLTDVCSVGGGRMWFGTFGGEVVCYTAREATVSGSGMDGGGGTWTIYDRSDGLAPGQVTSILSLRDGAVWVAHAASDQLDTFNGREWRPLTLPVVLPRGWQTWQPRPLPTTVPAGWLGDPGGKLLQTQDGVVWLSTLYKLYAYSDGHWRTYEPPDIPIPSSRNVLTQSAGGALWVIGSNNEAYRVDYQTPRWLTLEDLNYQWESSNGDEWFLHRSGRVVVHQKETWTSYGVEDGLIDTVVGLLGTRKGEVWAYGAHAGVAAVARFDGQRWTRTRHENFSYGIDWRAAFESSDGSLWFGGAVDTDAPEDFRNGILQFRNGVWHHHHQPGRSPHTAGAEDPATLLPGASRTDRPIEKFACFGESRDGRVWAGRNVVVSYDGRRWANFVPPPQIRLGVVETMLTTSEKDLWIGTREYGALRYDGREWAQFQGGDSLIANSVRSLTQTTDGSIWASTDRGFSRFDGHAWMPDVLPEPLTIPHEGGDLRSAPTGELWINRYTLYWVRRAWVKSPAPDPRSDFRTVRHQFQSQPPNTHITAGPKVVSQPGNIAVLWSGMVPWREEKDSRLQFSFRMDDEPWSTFTSERGHSFFTLRDGQHRLEVRARDADFNVDPTPATLEFVVLPPVWRQSWFIVLMAVLGGLIITQSVRVLLEQARLRKAHDELEVRVRQRTAELEAANRELEAFSYSVSHDLRAPLRSIDGFSKVLLEDYAPKLDDEGRANLNRVRSAAQRMGHLIEDMLKLSRVTRGELRMNPVNLSALVEEIAAELAREEPARKVNLTVAPGIAVVGDGNLLRIALENLLGNAWKFTSRREAAKIEFGVTEQGGQRVFFVRDNGAGFDMTYAGKLFGAFERLHHHDEFPGTGVGLAIVQRVIYRHRGRVWAEATVDGGATFFFTLGDQDRV
jgi:signal transduction histidine kinase/ligand-binding sensor domain-containing protein